MVCLAAIICRPQQAEAVTLYLTFQVPGTFAGTSFDYGDIVKYNTVTGTSSLFFDASDHFTNRLGSGGAFDGLEILPDGHMLFSLVAGARMPSIPAQIDKDDIVHYDPVARLGTIVLDGGDHFRDQRGRPFNGENIDVLDVLPDGSFLLSSRYDANWDGLAVDNDDIFRYDPASGTTSLFFDFDTIRDGRYQFNVDAFDILPDGRYLFSVFKQAELVGDLSIKGSDLIVYDPVTGDVDMFLDHNGIPDWKGKHRNFQSVDSESAGRVIPEPMSSVLFGLGLGGAGLRRFRRKRARHSA